MGWLALGFSRCVQPATATALCYAASSSENLRTHLACTPRAFKDDGKRHVNFYPPKKNKQCTGRERVVTSTSRRRLCSVHTLWNQDRRPSVGWVASRETHLLFRATKKKKRVVNNEIWTSEACVCSVHEPTKTATPKKKEGGHGAIAQSAKPQGEHGISTGLSEQTQAYLSTERRRAARGTKRHPDRQ
jgi:hypothetical protein